MISLFPPLHEVVSRLFQEGYYDLPANAPDPQDPRRMEGIREEPGVQKKLLYFNHNGVSFQRTPNPMVIALFTNQDTQQTYPETLDIFHSGPRTDYAIGYSAGSPSFLLERLDTLSSSIPPSVHARLADLHSRAIRLPAQNYFVEHFTAVYTPNELVALVVTLLGLKMWD
ncbi:hypothetical protein HZB00_03915 [Candidatus Woesearchaeota archaeon]|nr:hypothetical protein [Candidatus Woesearchaeota archaeon]